MLIWIWLRSLSTPTKDATEEKKRAQQTKNAPTKESLLNKIDEAEKELNAAQAKYKEAEKEATILSEEYLKNA